MRVCRGALWVWAWAALAACDDGSSATDVVPEDAGTQSRSDAAPGVDSGVTPDAAPACETTVPGNPQCFGPSPTAFPTEELSRAVVKCRWDAVGVIGTPVVADLEGDGQTDIVFVAEDDQLHIIDGGTCAETFAGPAPFTPFAPLAAADLDEDGALELVGISAIGEVVVADNRGVERARSANTADVLSVDRWGGASIANVDNEGPPEIVYAGLGLRYEGGALTELYRLEAAGSSRGSLTQLVDLDGDGRLELVTDRQILDATTGEDRTPDGFPGFQAALGGALDFDRDRPGPEIVVVAEGSGVAATVTVYDPVAGDVLYGPYAFSANQGGGSPPAAADVDGDGEAEIIVGGYDELVVVDRGCDGEPAPAACVRPGIAWALEIRDFTSAATTPTAFDLDGDGAAEVIARDECWLRILDGRTGAVRFADSVTSNTRFELPVVADVDGDGQAEIVTTANSTIDDCGAEASTGQAPTAPVDGVTVYEDAEDRWTPARPIWNQHTYTGAHIRDDGTVPTRPAGATVDHGRLRAQAPVLPTTFDLLVRPACGGEQTCGAGGALAAQVCNDGASAAPAGARLRFLEGATTLCESQPTPSIEPGACVTAGCTAADVAGRSLDLGVTVEPPESSAPCDVAPDAVDLSMLACP
jgi:hypothetical protein